MIVAWWADALRVVARDPVLQSVIESCRGEGLQETDDLMRSMVRAVCGQQVHNSAAIRQAQNLRALLLPRTKRRSRRWGSPKPK